MKEYGNGRRSVINEVTRYIESELVILHFLKDQIPKDTIDKRLTHKRATLAGNSIALNKIKALMKEKKRNLK